jgi:dihydrofolate reductase
MKPKLIFVAAVANKGVIGSENSIPWYIPEDLKHFKEVTLGKTVLMGKNTYVSIINRLGHPLPERKSIVVTHRTDLQLPPDVIVVNDLNKFLETTNESKIYVIGGGQIYNQLMDRADKLIITHVDKDIEGDVLFPQIDPAKWKKTFEEPHEGYSFVEYEHM